MSRLSNSVCLVACLLGAGGALADERRDGGPSDATAVPAAQLPDAQPLAQPAPQGSAPLSAAVEVPAASPGRRSTPCEAARAKFLAFASVDACREELPSGARLKCEQNAKDLGRLSELTDTCRKRRLYENDARKLSSDLRLAQVREEQDQLGAKIDRTAVRPRAVWYVPGAVGLVGGASGLVFSFFGSLGSSGRFFRLSGSDDFQVFLKPLNPVTTALLVGGLVAIGLGVVEMLVMKVLRAPGLELLAPLEKRQDELNRDQQRWEEYRDNGWEDFEEGRPARPAPQAPTSLPALPPLSVQFTAVTF